MNKFIEGKISKILYEGNNGYTVGIIRVFKSDDEEASEFIHKTLTFTYTGSPFNKELSYRLYGSLIEHPRFGMQYNVVSAEVVEPDDKEGIIMYLSSGLFKGIGVKTATNIVEKLGENAISLIKENKNNLRGVRGLSLSKIESLHDELLAHAASQELILYLNSLGFSTKESLNITSKYGANIYKIIDSDIYKLKSEVDFLKLDTIYLKEHDENSDIRVKALVEYIINNLCYKTGDTLVEKASVYLNIKKYFKEEFSLETFNYYISLMNTEGKVVILNELITLSDFYMTERYIASKIKFLNMLDSKMKEKDFNRYLDIISSERKIEFDDIQLEAIKNAVNNNFFIITGGPGTGKTTIIRAIVDIYKYDIDKKLGSNWSYYSAEKEKSKIVLLAPTGRSAKRMMESVKHPAYTIHKYLKWNKEKKEFGLNEDNKSDANIVIVDESSMVDIFLFSSLLKALKDDVKLILVGDEFQLPSIGPGNVLGDLLASEEINKTYLEKIYRTKENSYIPILASLIKNRDEFINDKKYSDFTFVESSDIYIKEHLKKIIESYKKKNLNLDDIEILAPMYKGENGIDKLNKLMQELVNPEDEDKKEIKYGEVFYREGDKILQLVNDVDNNVFNGDIGYIKDIYRKERDNIILIDFMGTEVEYRQDEYINFTHGYVISVHKSQGSEYDNVVVILSESFKRMFYNRLIYTAVTRAKKGLIIIGKESSMNTSINAIYSSNRISALFNLINE